MSNSQMPPIPPANRTDKGPAGTSDQQGRQDAQDAQDTSVNKGPPENLAEQGRQGNIRQNTHHQGYQQDR